MNTSSPACCALPAPIALRRPLLALAWLRGRESLAALLAALRRRWQAATMDAAAELSLQDAMALNDHTLRDIGAPEWLREQAGQQRERDSLALRAARLDLGGGGVRWYG